MGVPFVGLTGGLGAGKSTALAVLERLGAQVLSTDAVVHELYAGETVRQAVMEHFGEGVLRDGVVDRGAIAQRVFGDPQERQWLESLLWPLVGARVIAAREAADATVPLPRACVIETPLLFEAGMDAMYDATIAVVTQDALREERTAGRGLAAVAERESRQLSQAEKARRAAFVVRNDGSLEDLELQLSEVLDNLGR